MITNTVGLPILCNHVYVGPSIASDVTVISTYTSSAESAELNEVLVEWEHVVRNGDIRTYVRMYVHNYGNVNNHLGSYIIHMYVASCTGFHTL